MIRGRGLLAALLIAALGSAYILAQSTIVTVPKITGEPVPGSGTFAGAISAGTTSSASGQFLAGNGTAGAPSYAFTSEPTLGFWRSAAGIVTLQGRFVSTSTASSGLTSLGGVYAQNGYTFGTGSSFLSPTSGVFNVLNNGSTIGSQIKVDALPTIASGFGTGAAVTAGSTPFAGSVNVGTGGVASAGTVNFNGTAFPSAPFCVATNQQASVSVRVAASTTNAVFTNASAAAWPANEVVTWICVSSK